MISTKRAFVNLAFLAILCGPAFAQSPGNQFAISSAPIAAPTATPAFDLADVHPRAKTTTPNFTGGRLHGDRYICCITPPWSI